MLVFKQNNFVLGAILVFVKNEPIFDWSCLKNSGTSQHKLFQHCIGGIKRIEIK